MATSATRQQRAASSRGETNFRWSEFIGEEEEPSNDAFRGLPEHSRESLSTIPETSRESIPATESPLMVKGVSAASSSAAPPIATVHLDAQAASPHRAVHQERDQTGDLFRTPTKQPGSSHRPSSQQDMTPRQRRRRPDRDNPSPSFRPQLSHLRRSKRIQAHLDEASAVLDLIQREKIHQANVDLLAQSFQGQMLDAMTKQRLQLEQQAALLEAAAIAAESSFNEFAQRQLDDFEQELAALQATHDAAIDQLRRELDEKDKRLQEWEAMPITVCPRWIDAASWVFLALAVVFALTQTWQCLWASLMVQDEVAMQQRHVSPAHATNTT